MFNKASRMKLRFSHKGLCTVEDLWDIPLDSLDSMFQELNGQVKAQSGLVSLLTQTSTKNEELDLKIGLIRHIVGVRLAEVQSNQDSVLRKAKKQKILSLIEDKQDENLRGKSLDELKALLEE